MQDLFQREWTDVIWLRVAAASDTFTLASLLTAVPALGRDRNPRCEELWHAHAHTLDRHVRSLSARKEELDARCRAPARTPEWIPPALESAKIRLLTARLMLEYLICRLHPIPGFRVDLADGKFANGGWWSLA